MKAQLANSFAIERYRPQQNALLAALSAIECRRLVKELELVPLAAGQVLYDAGQTMSHAYFPLDCMVSLLYTMKNGQLSETAIVGNDGIIGIALFMGGESTQGRAIVQNAGHAYRLKAQVLKSEFHRGNALHRLLLLFASALITQMVQTAACSRHHTLDQQLCRWMLLRLDRLPSLRTGMTEKRVGSMLGRGSTEASKATRLLQDAGLVNVIDGEITVVDRNGIEKRACECYAVVRREIDRLLPVSGEIAA